MEDYSIWFLEYAYIKEFAKGLAMMGDFNEGYMKLPHGYVYMEGNNHKVLIDTGYSYKGENKRIADSYGLQNYRCVDKVLALVGTKPEEIDTVLLTHAHIDHAANTQAFPNAVFYMQERELFESIRMMQLPASFASLTGALCKEDLLDLVRLVLDNRLILLNGDTMNVLPGIDAFTAFNTHSPGHQFFFIRNERQKNAWVCCGDLVFKYENLTGRNKDGVYVPIVNGGGSHYELLKAYKRIFHLLDGDAFHVIPMHEPALPEIFPSKKWADQLFMTEISLADGMKSKL